MIEDEATPVSTEKSKMKGYLKQLKSLQFVIHMLIFKVPLAKISVSFQKESCDLLFALSLLEDVRGNLQEWERTVNFQRQFQIWLMLQTKMKRLSTGVLSYFIKIQKK